MNEIFKTEEAIFNFLTEAEEKNMIGTQSREAEQNLQNLLEELSQRIADNENSEELKFFIENLKDAVFSTNRIVKREYFNFGMLQKTLKENR